jgi:DNA-binding CsgD family transcriptional regulator
MRILVFIFVFALSWISLRGIPKTEGTPFINYYSYDDYRVSNNNWDMVQDQRHIMYFANEFGILEFDGVRWQIIQVATNRSNIKSLAIDKNGRLFAGAQGDFGYLDYQEPYGLTFFSLIDKIPEECRDFGDIWQTITKDDKVVFHSWKSLFVYENNEIKAYKTGKKITGMFKLPEKLIVQDEEAFYELTDKGLKPLNDWLPLKDKEIRFILPFRKSEFLVGTHLNGLLVFDGKNALPFNTTPEFSFIDGKITCGHLRKNGNIVIGTAQKGVCFINSEGYLVRHISKENGIQNNEIRHLFSDQNNNLWVANKKGIDFIQLASPFSRIIPDPEEPQGVYSATSFNEHLLFATHNGLLKTPMDHLTKVHSEPVQFSRINGTPDINWKLTKIDKSLIIAHSRGFSQLINNQTIPVYTNDGGWQVTKIPGHEGFLIGGTYSGLVLLEQKNGRYQFVKELKGFGESSRIIEADVNNNIWVAHGYKGIYKIKLKEDLSHIESVAFYGEAKGLPSNIYNTVFKVWDQIVFGTQQGFYRYDATNDSMIIDNELTGLTGSGQGRILKEDDQGNVWFVAGEETGIITKHADESITVEKTPFIKLSHHYIPGFENFHFLNNQQTLIGTKNGVILYDAAKKNATNHHSQVLLREVTSLNNGETIYSDRLHYLCDTLTHKDHEFPFRFNSFRFSFSPGIYEDKEDIQYQYFLQGLDSDWSSWESIQSKVYEDLREGEYLFRVRAKNAYNSVSPEATYKFVIKPPFYRTNLAYGSYFTLLGFTFMVFFRVRTLKVKREKQRYIEEQNRLRQLDQANYLKEKLQNQLKEKESKLSGLNMEVIQKEEKITKLKDNISGIIQIAPEKVSKELSKVLEFIKNELDAGNHDDFEKHFDEAHNHFLKRLKSDYPDLTPKDLKICAYLKMNLTSKEIANLLNMTVRGVENARYRIRKRLHLDASDNLTEWILLRK